ncbi:MAG: hypothetical protein JST00_15920 [Deltaproteobacteria bacterium]|nr:hypothetical protein [Deltaproteobacteria bacterium]
MRRTLLALALCGACCIFHTSAARADEAAAEPSPEEIKQARAEIDAVLGEMRATSQRLREQLRAARQKGTRAQITCVDESLSRVDVALRTAKDAAGTSLRAYADKDVWSARDARRRMVEWRDAARIAAREGSSCAVSSIALKSGTTVTMSVDPKIPKVSP